MQRLILIALFGVLGTLARYGCSQWIDARTGAGFPYGTLTVNLAGCFAAGVLLELFSHAGVNPDLRLAVFAGFLGAFTTFSAYGVQTLTLVRNGAAPAALLNVLLSNAAGLFLVWMGSQIGRRAL
jgi:CrcB protein